MKRNKTIGFAILAAIGCVVLLVILRGSSEEPRHNAPKAARSPSAPNAGRNVLSINQLYAEGQALAAGDAVKADSSKIEPQGSTGGLDDTIAEVLAADPELRKFHDLRKKALRTAAEQQDYLAMISNAKLIDDARKDLLAAASADDLDQGEEIERIQHIEFLNSALAWEDNPSRSKALEAVTQVVMADIPAETSKPVAGSVLGDKFDLFQLLMVSDPDQAKALLAQARGTASEKILLLAWQTGSADKSNQIP